MPLQISDIKDRGLVSSIVPKVREKKTLLQMSYRLRPYPNLPVVSTSFPSWLLVYIHSLWGILLPVRVIRIPVGSCCRPIHPPYQNFCLDNSFSSLPAVLKVVWKKWKLYRNLGTAALVKQCLKCPPQQPNLIVFIFGQVRNPCHPHLPTLLALPPSQKLNRIPLLYHKGLCEC